MKKLILALSILVLSLVGCSSAPVKDSAATKKEGSSSPPPNIMRNDGSKSVEAAKAEPESQEAEPAENVKKFSEEQYSGLNKAIRAQADDEIAKAATKLLLENPKDVRALNALALVNYKKGRFDTALYLLNKAIAQNSNSSEVYSNLGLVYLATQEKREALRAFKKALEINSQDPVAAANLGAIYAQEKDFNKAVIALEIAYSHGFRDAKIGNNYAISLVATGKNAEAEAIFKKLLKENSSNKEALFNYIIFLVDHLQNYKDGLEYINRLKFVGVPPESRNRIIALENKAKAGLK